ncbi:flagellin [Acidaminobacter sp. JC074]|uniref:flagellinolysin n=1 Tax=Acidaminobacter sp. JC074 TaxID=2530199 RepID=UPI0021044FC8|nr:flagellinolysin [Acidaminobacter sp. JC074]MCH4889287.1 flagellin [Acidaminobacter sp. JC074]
MRINNNLMAMNTHRVLGINQENGSKSIEKLSSGFRINRAGDDAAGLAISEKMRGQIRGLNQASRNAQDGVSLLQTTEGALNETHAILQRMRELAVQGANDTNVDEDRKQLNAEISQLKSEVDRIANATEFNTKKMLNYGAQLQADGFDGISQSVINTLNTKIPEWINDSMVAINERFGIEFPDSPTNRTMNIIYEQGASYGAAMASPPDASELTLRINLDSFVDSNGNLRDEGTLDTLIAHEVMHAFEFTEMSSLLNAGTSPEETWFMEGLSMLVQGGNGWTASELGGAENAVVSGAFSNSLADYASAFVALKTLHEITSGGINSVIDAMESGATLDQAIQATSQGDRGEVTSTGTYDHVASGDTGYHSWAEFITDFNAGDFDNYLSSSTDFTQGTGTIVSGSVAGSSSNLSLDATIPNGTGTAEVYTHYTLNFTSDSASTTESDTPETILFHIGANQGQNLTFNTFDATSNGLGIDSVNVSTQATSDSAIKTINDAIIKVSDKRSEIGAIQNRLEHTIKSLDISAENLQASESRIRDVDMASEMMNFTKNNILQQAAQSMLAQANQAPQGVLQLLR